MKTCKSYERDGKELKTQTASREETLDSLLRSHERAAHRFACSLAKNPEEAKELVQEASYQVLRHWKKYDPLQSFTGWYLTILRNLFLRNLRVSKRTLSLSTPVAGDEECGLVDLLADGGVGILEQVERHELVEAARDALKALGKKYRVVVSLCDLEGLSYDDAARRLGIPSGTVRSRLSRARAALRCDPSLRRLA